MGEKLNVKRTTKYGIELQEPKEDGSPNYRNTTDQVRNFLNKQTPCLVEVEGMEGNNISRVKVLTAPTTGKTGQGIDPATIPTSNDVTSGFEDRQKSIESQFCIREALRMIEINNSLEEEKMKPTQSNVYETALIIRSILDKLKK